MKTAVLFGAALLAGFAGAQGKSERPNVVFIISDDHGWSDYGFMGHAQIATPRLDRLATDAITFTRGYSVTPLCRPSLASIATGLYPHQHGVTGNDPALPKEADGQRGRENPEYAPYYQTIVDHFARQPNFVRDLTARGYVTLQTGKWWEGDPQKTAGFTHAMTAGTKKNDRHGGAGLAIGRDGIAPIRDFIEQAGDKPFLVWYAPMLPHAPHNPPDELLQKYLKLAPNEPLARYWASVEWFDNSCGELLDYLDQRGLRENTIIVYVADNGYIQDQKKSNKPEARSKLTSYEGGVRTPIMVSWPAKLKPRMDTEHLASSLDLWPTLAALLQLDAPNDLPGINLADEAAVAKRQVIFGEQYAHNIADVNQPTDSLESRWIIDGHWKLIAFEAGKKSKAKMELYDLKNDPWEKNDLAAKDPERVTALSNQLNQWWKPTQKKAVK